MGEKQKVVVSEAMLAASLDALRIRWQYRLGWEPDMNTVEANRCSLGAALDWLKDKIEGMRVENNTHWQAGRNHTIDEILKLFLAPKEDDPLVMYIMRHFDDIIADQASLRNRALVAVADYKEHVKRNGPKVENFDIFQDEFRKGSKADKPLATEVPFGTGFYVSPKSNDFPVVGFTEPEAPEEIKDIKRYDFNPHDGEEGMELSADGDYILFTDAIEAFNRGQKAGGK